MQKIIWLQYWQYLRSFSYGLAPPFMELLVGKLERNGQEVGGQEASSANLRYLGTSQTYRETRPQQV